MKKILSISFLAALMILVACKKDFIVEDIDDKSLIVNAPANNLVTPNNSVTFWWEYLDGAEKYNLQIVKPSFANVAELVTDTNVSTNKFTVSLQPGTYQWRIKATNAGHATVYQTYNLKVDSSNVLTNQFVVPVSPLSGTVSRNKTQTFTWNPLYSATSYSIEISQNNAVINYSVVNTTSYTYTFSMTAAQNYTISWRVKAINAGSVSQYNTPQTFTIDLVPPAVSTPTAPANNATVADTIALKWNRSGTETSFDSIFIYTDAAMTASIRSMSVATNSITINAISPPLPAGTGSLNAIPYWWRLKSVDAVGNTSTPSTSRSFNLYQ